MVEWTERRIRAVQWAIVDSLVFNLKGSSETRPDNFKLPRKKIASPTLVFRSRALDGGTD